MEEKVISKQREWKPVIFPPDSYTLDSQPMVGTTYLERPAPAVYLDSWLMEGASYPEPHVDWEVLSSKPSLNNVAIVKMVDTDASDDVNTQLPENVTLMPTPMTAPAWPCVESPRSSTAKHDMVNRRKDSREIEMTRPDNTPPMIDPIVTQKNMPENLTPVSTPMTSLTWPCVDSPQSPMVEYDSVNRMKDGHEIEMTRPENAPPMEDPNVTINNRLDNLTSVSTPLTSLAWPCVDSPRLLMVKHEIVIRMKDGREMKMSRPKSVPPTKDSNGSMKYWEDRICHLLIYVGDFPHNVLRTTNHNPEAANIQHEADDIFTSTGRTATQTGGWLEVENNSDTDPVAELEYNTWDDARAWEFRNARGNINVSLSQNYRMEMNREHVLEVDAVIGSDADYCAMKRASRRWERQCTPCQCPPAEVPPTLVRKPALDGARSYVDNHESMEKCKHEEWIDRIFHSPWTCDNHQYGLRNSGLQIYDNMAIADCLQPENGNCLSHAVCDDSVTLMPLIQLIRALHSNGGDTAGRSGHDSDNDGSPAGLLGYLPQCLYWPWSLHGMMQCQVKIKEPSANRLSRVVMYDGGLWDTQSSATRPVTHAETVIYPTVIGLRAAVGGSAAKSDWLRALGPADRPPSGIWIGFIRRTVEVNCCSDSDSDRVTEISYISKPP